MVRFLSPAELQPDADAQDAELSEDAVFDLRDAHVLYFDGEGEDAWRTQFPYLAWLREPGGDRFYCSRASCYRSCDWCRLTSTLLV